MTSKTTEMLLAPPGEELARLIAVVGAAELEQRGPVTVQYASRLAKVDVASVVRGSPSAGGPLRILEWSYGPLWVQLQGGMITEESKIGLTALGLYLYVASETHESSLVERYLDAVRLVVFRYQQFEPSPTEVQHPMISHSDLTSQFKALGVMNFQVDHVADLVAIYLKRDLVLFLGGAQIEGSNWKQEIHSGVERFEGIKSFPDYLERIVGLLEPAGADGSDKGSLLDGPLERPFEVALSFAGEERAYVEGVAQELKGLGAISSTTRTSPNFCGDDT